MRKTYKSLFERYQDQRVLMKCKDFAKWTLPKLMAEVQQHGESAIVERDYQEGGALLVNNLTSKLCALLFPSNRPFFGIDPSAALRKKAEDAGHEAAAFSAALAKMEMDASQRVFLNSSYNQLSLSIAHLIITGNACVFRDSKTARSVAYGLTSYGVRRSGQGDVVDAVIREYESFAGLSRDMQVQLSIRQPNKYKMEDHDVSVEIYTRIKRESNQAGDFYYVVSQELEGIPVGRPGTYPAHLCPWQFPVWSLISGEHYGRGIVEDYAGGFAAMSDKSEALALYGIAACKFVNLVQPGAGVVVDDIHAAETGEYVSGTNGAVQVQEAGNGPKIQAMRAEVEYHFSKLARAFMYTGNTRDAERVTAFELRQQAQEANTTLGGTYSALAETYQGPLANILLTEVEPGVLEGLLTGHAKVNIIAGIPALSRGIGVQNLASAAADAGAIYPVLTQIDKRVDPNRLMDMIYAGQSVDTSQFHRTPEAQAEFDAAQAEKAQAEQQIVDTNVQADQLAALQQLPGMN